MTRLINPKEKIGERVLNTRHNEWMEIIDWIDCLNIVVKFEDGHLKNTNNNAFKKGKIKKYNNDDYIKLRTGKQKYNIDNELMTIIKYNNASDVLVEFENKKTLKCNYTQFKTGSLQNNKDRVGDKNFTNEENEIEIIRYKSASDITIRFDDGTTRETNYNLFKKGSIRKNAVKEIRIGEEITNDDNEIVKIVDYIDSRNISILFEDGEILNTSYQTFLNKPKCSNSIANNNIGLKNKNNDNILMEIIKYVNSNNITVRFEDGYIKQTSVRSFNNGSANNPYFKSIADFGFLGEGKYSARVDDKITPQYQTWASLIMRTYDPYTINKCPSYINCEVCDDWADLQKFGKYYDENIYYIPNEKMQIDKDILCNYLKKDAKIYSPDTCIFVPQTINNLFPNHKRARGNEVIGVYFDGRPDHKLKNRYTTYISKFGKRIHLGSYRTENEAFNVYKQAKEDHVKEIANLYKQYIPTILYKVMYAFEVKITD